MSGVCSAPWRLANRPRYQVIPVQRFKVATPEVVALREAAIRGQLGVPLSVAASRFECGYQDYGESRLVQPGCLVDVRDGEGETTSFVIPAAQNPSSDPTWPEIETVRQGREQSRSQQLGPFPVLPRLLRY